MPKDLKELPVINVSNLQFNSILKVLQYLYELLMKHFDTLT